MAAELMLISCPSLGTDPKALFDFCEERVSLTKKSMILFTSADSGAVRTAAEFVATLQAPQIVVDFKWDSMHTPDCSQPLIDLPNAVAASEYFGPETEEEFSSRMGTNFDFIPEATKVVLVDQSVIDTISQLCSYDPDQVLLLLGQQEDQGIVILKAISFSEYKSFEEEWVSARTGAQPEATAVPEAAVAPKVKAVVVEEAKAVVAPEAKAVIPEAKAVILEAKAVVPEVKAVLETKAVVVQEAQQGRFVLPPDSLDSFKASIVDVVRESIAGGQGGLSVELLKSIESKVADEASKFIAQVTTVVNETMKKQSSEITHQFGQMQTDHFNGYNKAVELLKSVRSQQEAVLKVIQETTESVLGRPGSLSPKEVDNLVKSVECYENVNAVLLQMTEKLKPTQEKKLPLEITDAQEGDGDEVYDIVVRNRKMYPIEELDVELESVQTKARSILAHGVRATVGEGTIQMKIPSEVQGKFNLYLSQRGKRLSENFDIALDRVESDPVKPPVQAPSLPAGPAPQQVARPQRTEFPFKGGAGVPPVLKPSIAFTPPKFLHKEESKDGPKPAPPTEPKPAEEPKPAQPSELKPTPPAEAKPSFKPEEIKAPTSASQLTPSVEVKPPFLPKPSTPFMPKPFSKPGPFAGIKAPALAGKFGATPSLTKSGFMPSTGGKLGAPTMPDWKKGPFSTSSMAKPAEPTPSDSSELPADQIEKINTVKGMMGEGWNPTVEQKLIAILKTERGAFKTSEDLFNIAFDSP